MSLQYEFKAQTIVDEGRTSQEAIDEIKNWLQTTNFPEIPEELIALFLLSCHNVIASTQGTIKAYFRITREAPELFKDRDVDSEELKKASRVVSCISIPKRLSNNSVIHFFKINDSNYQNFDWVLSMKLACMLLGISQRNNPPNEVIVVIDMKGIGFMHIPRLKLGTVKKFLEFIQEAMPLRIKMIHILNTNYLFDKLLSIVRIFLKNDLMAIIKTHPPDADMAQFYKNWIPASCLPKDYGGDLPTTEELNESMIQKFRELKTFFEAEEKLISFQK